MNGSSCCLSLDDFVVMSSRHCFCFFRCNHITGIHWFLLLHDFKHTCAGCISRLQSGIVAKTSSDVVTLALLVDMNAELFSQLSLK